MRARRVTWQRGQDEDDETCLVVNQNWSQPGMESFQKAPLNPLTEEYNYIK